MLAKPSCVGICACMHIVVLDLSTGDETQAACSEPGMKTLSMVELCSAASGHDINGEGHGASNDYAPF